MRVRIATIQSRISYPYTDTKTPEDVITERLTEFFSTAPCDWGRVTEVFEVETSPLARVMTYEDGLKLEIDFIAKLRIEYLKEGDVLFSASIQGDREDFNTVHTVTLVPSTIPIAIQTSSLIQRANVTIIVFRPDPEPRYFAEFAIYPNYAPIIAGRERASLATIEPLYYMEDIRSPPKPRLNKTTAFILDPISDMKPGPRKERIINDILTFMNMDPGTPVRGVDKVLRGLTPSVGEAIFGEPNAEIVPLENLWETLSSRQTDSNRVDLMYVPSIPLFVYVCVIINKPIAPVERSPDDADLVLVDHYSEIAVEAFKNKVYDYLGMKYKEFLSIPTLAKNSKFRKLVALYKAARSNYA